MPGTREESSKESVSKQLNFDEKPKKEISKPEVNGGTPKKNLRVFTGGKPVLLPNESENGQNGEASLDIRKTVNNLIVDFKDRLKLLRTNVQIKELQTTLRDRYDFQLRLSNYDVMFWPKIGCCYHNRLSGLLSE